MIFDTVNVGCLKVLEKGQFDKKKIPGGCSSYGNLPDVLYRDYVKEERKKAKVTDKGIHKHNSEQGLQNIEEIS